MTLIMASGLGAGGRKLLSSLRRSNSSCVPTIQEAGSVSNAVDPTRFPRGASSASLASTGASMDGLLKYEDLVGLLTCGLCGMFCGPTMVQCRKGHVICRKCKTDRKLTSCHVCKQTFVDAPNVVLEKMISLIALPCRFRVSGCPEFIFAEAKLEHETFCPYRPIACQYAVDGCEQEMPYKHLSAHHRACSYNPRAIQKET